VNILQFIISILLFLILFFGIGFILNMLLKTTWLPGLILYPIIVIMIVTEVPLVQFVKDPASSLAQLGTELSSLLAVDYVVLGAGLLGAVLSGVSIKLLRQKGFRMF
jgi:hypothetical protein